MRIDGQRLKAARERQFLTLDDMAQKSGVSVSNLSRIENEKQEPELRTVKRIVEALSLSVDELLPERKGAG